MNAEQNLSEIEKEFVASWDHMVTFFTDMITKHGWESLKPTLDLIAELRKRGYDKKFRAGQSMWIFIISRSRKHGLRPGQANIQFQPNEKGGLTARYAGESPEHIDIEQIELTSQLEGLLIHLSMEPII